MHLFCQLHNLIKINDAVILTCYKEATTRSNVPVVWNLSYKCNCKNSRIIPAVQILRISELSMFYVSLYICENRFGLYNVKLFSVLEIIVVYICRSVGQHYENRHESAL